MEYEVTLAMPVYNVAAYVEKSLLSALNQTFDSIEFIIVDDRGTDESMDIVRTIISKHLRGKDVKIIEHEKNIGLGGARNTAIENASGKYIYFMDSDDEITLDCIEILYNKMQEYPVDFIAASFYRSDRNGNVLENVVYSEKIISGKYEVANSYYTKKKGESLVICTWNKLYCLSLLKDNNIRCVSHHMSEDILFTFQVLLYANSCHLISEKTYIYYDVSDSLSKKSRSKFLSSRYGKQYAEIISFELKYIDRYKGYPAYEKLLISFIYQVMDFILLVNKSEVIAKGEKKEYLRQILIFPINWQEIKEIKNRKMFFYLYYFIFRMPFPIFNFKLINYLSNIKKKILH